MPNKEYSTRSTAAADRYAFGFIGFSRKNHNDEVREITKVYRIHPLGTTTAVDSLLMS